MNVIIFIVLIILARTKGFKVKVGNTENSKILPRFWTSTGFCPIGENITEILKSYDTLTNIQLIGTIPNQGLSYIRIHWMLDLIKSKISDKSYDELDSYTHFLVDNGLIPHFEFMSHNRLDWEKTSFDILDRYSKFYSANIVQKWRFETWNEPDLKMYNVLNFTETDFHNYLTQIKNGFSHASKKLNVNFEYFGPAGLFRSVKEHRFCWESLNMPFDVITFHRKGEGKAIEIVDNSVNLIKEIIKQFPKLKNSKFSNSEADPIVKWSEPRDFQADVQYGVTLVETVALFWNQIFEGNFNLDSISHDNAFLSYFPNQFTQRTLLARFQMNNTVPPHTQFFLKPIFLAFNMLSNLGKSAGRADIFQTPEGNLTVFHTFNLETSGEKSYFGTILSLSRNSTALIELNWHIPGDNWFYIIEYLAGNLTSSYHVWKKYGSPAYPSKSIRNKMRRSQDLLVQIPPQPVQSIGSVILNVPGPAVLLVRFCNWKNMNDSPSPSNFRFNKVNNEEVIILWSVKKSEDSKCVYEYQVYFKAARIDRKQQSKWIKITRNRHVTVNNFQFVNKIGKSVIGCFKVRSVNIMGHKGPFSKTFCYRN